MAAGDPSPIRKIDPDPARDARRARYKAIERARISRALDNYLHDTYGDMIRERYAPGEGDSR